MKITEIPHDCDKFFLNGDLVSMQNYVVINDQKEIFRNGVRLDIKVDYSYSHPKVSIISSNQFLLVDSDKPKNSSDTSPNAWVINNNGEIEQSFFLGVVHRMITTNNYIICSYTDSQLDSNWKYGQNGLVVFDFNGKSLFEYYRDEEKSKWLNFLENYAFFKKNDQLIYYLPFHNDSIVAFSLVDFSSNVLLQFSFPKNHSLGYPKAFSKKGNDWFFITPDRENSNSSIFKLDTQKQIQQIGTCCYSNSPKGFKGGKFFVPFSGGFGNQRKCQLVEI